MIAPSPVTGIKPRISRNAFIASNSVIIGDVTIESGANIWFGAVLRGERNRIYVGQNTSIQENVVLHAEPGTECLIQDHIIVGHQAVVHGPCIIERCVLVGMNATVLHNTTVGEGAIIGGGATARNEIKALTLVVGTPAVEKKVLPPSHLEEAKEEALKYAKMAQYFLNGGFQHPDIEAYYFD